MYIVLWMKTFFFSISPALLFGLLGVNTGCVLLPDPPPLAPEGQAHGFHKFEATPPGWETQHHAVYVPSGYTPEKEWPLIIFLHGWGEKGHDGRRPTGIGLGPAIEQHPERFPTLVLFPQSPPPAVFGDREERRHMQTPDASPHITAALEYVLTNYSVDEDRVTLTGVSMGGFGTFYYGAAHADRFAGLMPVSGGGRLADAPVLADMPMWIFHGAKDSIVDVSESAIMVSAIQAAGGNPRLTIYPDLGHAIWDRVYNDPAVVEWLLAQRRQSPQ